MSADDKIPEPHPLPLTRQWVEDYERATSSTLRDAAAKRAGTVPTAPPDLQELVERAGRRYAASIGEEYIEDPFRRMKEAPHQGGYPHITPEEWVEYDRALAAWRATGKDEK
jgi:hypothetical protein